MTYEYTMIVAAITPLIFAFFGILNPILTSVVSLIHF